jgi:hypothetical protein
MEKFCIGLYTLVPPMEVLNRVTVDTGFEAPDPPLTEAEVECLARAAKLEFGRILKRRLEAKRATERSALQGEGKKDFTEPQVRELLLLFEGPQPTYGKGRARVQNQLVSWDLAFFSSDSLEDLCVITEAGIAAAKALMEGRASGS